jgi:6-phosphogluconolactonase (cycloisomerase 2 family)
LPKDFHGKSTTAAIRCVGNTVYVSNRGHDSISVLYFSNGHLALNKTISTYGASPRDFLIYHDLIISANERSDEVTLVFTDKKHLVKKIAIKSPVCVTVNQ